MFDQLRYNLKHNRKSVMRSATAWLIFGAIILVFVFWGMSPRNQGVATGGAAATVNDANISILQFNETMDRMSRDPRFEQLQALGGNAGRQILQQQALSQLVQNELIHQATEKAHIWTTDAEVRDVIRSIPSFQENGQFKPALYMAYVEQARKTPAELEDEIRQDESRSRVFRMFSAALKPLPMEAEKEKQLQNLRADLEYVSVPTENLVIPETISSADVKAFMAQAGNDAKIKDYFESHKQDFASAEKVKVRHILIRTKSGDAESEKKALAKIEDIAKKAKTEDFGKLASQYSEDPASKTKGGVLDFFTRGKMVPEFEEAAFKQPVNEIGAPVKTEYGYHLIQVLEKKPAKNPTLDEVREEIASLLIAKDRSHVAIEHLQDALKKGDVSAVNSFISEHKLKWEDTGPFSITAESIPKVGPNEEVLRTAFELTPEKPLAASLVREGGRALIVRYKAPPAAKAETKDEKADLMAEMQASRRSEDALQQWAEGLRKNAKISTNGQFFKGQSED